MPKSPILPFPVADDMFINDVELIKDNTLAEILRPHKITHLRYRGIVIEAGLMRDRVKITYPNGLSINYSWFADCMYRVKVKIDGKRGKISSYENYDIMDMEVKVTLDTCILRMKKAEDDEGYDIMMNENREVISSGAKVAALSMGDYEFAMSPDGEYDLVTLREIHNDYDILKTRDGDDLIVRLDADLSFNCYNGLFLDTR